MQVFGKPRVSRKHTPSGSNLAAPADGERWLRLLHGLHLGPVQREHLLTLRTRQLAKLAKLTDARRFLSMQVGPVCGDPEAPKGSELMQ